MTRLSPEYVSIDAVRYWTDEPETMVEVLIGGPIRIMDCLFDEGEVWASRICSHLDRGIEADREPERAA